MCLNKAKPRWQQRGQRGRRSGSWGAVMSSAQRDFFKMFVGIKKKIEAVTNIVLTMIGVSNSNKTSYRNGCQSRTNAYI